MTETTATSLGRNDGELRPVRVVFVPHPYQGDLFEPFGRDVVTALGGRHHLTMYDLRKPPQGQLADAEVVIDHGGQARTRAMADACVSLKLWQILGMGYDHFDLGYWRQKGIPVANTPGPCSADSLAESALMLMLMLSHKYGEATSGIQRGVMYQPIGNDLAGRTLGLIGFGASAQALALRARAFGMRLRATEIRRVGADEMAHHGLDWVGGPESLDVMLPDCDIVSLHLHLNDQTRHILDARHLALMKPTSLLINVARGELVDEAALEQALLQGRLAGAGLDVFGQEPPDMSRPMFRLPNVVATPHIAGNTDRTSLLRAQCVAANVDRVAAGAEPLNVVA